MRGVSFTPNLLNRLLNAVCDPHRNNRPHLGHVDFRRASFSKGVKFYNTLFSGSADFSQTSFSGETDFNRTLFSGFAQFIKASFSGSTSFNGTSFSWGADFTKASFSKYASFTGASFLKNTFFTDVSFSGDIHFNKASFSGDANFNRTLFSRDSNFAETSFSGETYFIGASFSGHAEFYAASFFGGAHFDTTSFSTDSSFTGASFYEIASFERASFSGHSNFDRTLFFNGAHFNKASFSKEVTWTRCRISTLSLDEAIAEKEMRVEAVADQVSARRMRAVERVTLRLRSARVDLTELVCSGAASVHALAQPIPNVPDLEDRPAKVAVTSLRGADVESLTLTDVDLSECTFAGMHRVDQIQLDGDCTFASGPGRRRMLAEEHHWQAQRHVERRGHPSCWHLAPAGVEVLGPRRIEVIYRQLRKALEEGKNEPGAADFYYGEMQMRRAAARSADRLLLWLYWAVSGYGLRARRALVWVLVVAVLSIAGMTAFGFPQNAKAQKATGTIVTPAGPQAVTLTIRQDDPAKNLPERLEKAVEVTVNAVIFRSPDTELTTAGRYLNIVVRILGPILLGLAILAIRNQVKR
ncbi:pentapeptide repeat-containing protein [Thermomonospora curvata]|uniref:pentapeptide repeat-containing protein n=1 Tax=Thermomonospora curvata TaxID=2020 RepID=UPI0011D2A995|nr:pentapeptide repeat-containing protein [Thermomonospora curvata]